MTKVYTKHTIDLIPTHVLHKSLMFYIGQTENKGKTRTHLNSDKTYYGVLFWHLNLSALHPMVMICKVAELLWSFFSLLHNFHQPQEGARVNKMWRRYRETSITLSQMIHKEIYQ